jgi:hypothetical protein
LPALRLFKESSIITATSTANGFRLTLEEEEIFLKSSII